LRCKKTRKSMSFLAGHGFFSKDTSLRGSTDAPRPRGGRCSGTT
jgi:hypothetical protein